MQMYQPSYMTPSHARSMPPCGQSKGVVMSVKMAALTSLALLVGSCQGNLATSKPESALITSYFACADGDATQYIRNISSNPSVSRAATVSEMNRLRHEGKCKLFDAGSVMHDVIYSNIKQDIMRFTDPRDKLVYWAL